MIRSLRYIRKSSISTQSSNSKLINSSIVRSLSEWTGEAPEPHTQYSFETSFHCDKETEIFKAQEGAYMDIDKLDIEKYFPEGFAGEANQEFEFSGRHSWMIRDISKVVCNLIDEYEISLKKNKGQSVDSIRESKNRISLHKPVVIKGLTDKTEWNDSNIRIRSNGKDLLTTSDASNKGDFKIACGEGSIVNKFSDEINKLDKFPDKILISGKNYYFIL